MNTIYFSLQTEIPQKPLQTPETMFVGSVIEKSKNIDIRRRTQKPFRVLAAFSIPTPPKSLKQIPVAA